MIAVLLLCACGVETPAAIAGDDGMEQTPERLVELRAAAQSGDLAAAQTLSVHYDTVGDVAEAEVWLRRAAELGDCEALQILRERSPDKQVSAPNGSAGSGTTCDAAGR